MEILLHLMQLLVEIQSDVLKPTHYKLRHYASYDREALRNWRLEGSNDKKNWTILKNHVNDESIKEKGQCCTWKVDNTSGKKDGSSKFRILITGQNSSMVFQNL